MLAAIAAAFAPAPAIACLAAIQPEAVLFDSPPPSRPPDHALLKVTGRVVDPRAARLLVRIEEPALQRRLGRLAWLEADPISSCTTWGRVGSEAYVVARVSGRERGRWVLTARVYLRSRWDRIRDMVGWETYIASGPPLSRADRLPIRLQTERPGRSGRQLL